MKVKEYVTPEKFRRGKRKQSPWVSNMLQADPWYVRVTKQVNSSENDVEAEKEPLLHAAE